MGIFVQKLFSFTNSQNGNHQNHPYSNHKTSFKIFALISLQFSRIFFALLFNFFYLTFSFSFFFRSRNESFVLLDNEWPRCIEDTGQTSSSNNRKKRLHSDPKSIIPHVKSACTKINVYKTFFNDKVQSKSYM